MRRSTGGLLITIPLALAFAAGAAAEVRPGARGYGETVFVGETVERFEVEILGTIHGWGSTGDIILARLSGASLEHTGVPQGMSGSPVWIEGELVGAVMSTWPFAKEAIAGIRPIEEMRKLGAFLEEGGHPTWKPGEREVGAPPWPRGEPVGWPLEESPPGDGAAALDPPPELLRLLGSSVAREIASLPSSPAPAQGGLFWTASGFGSGVRRDMEQRLGAPVLAGSGPGDAGSPEAGDALDATEATLAPGDAMAVLLIDGDARLAAVGTVTDRQGDTILGFGHPFLGLGPVSLPVARARVVTVLPSQQVSFKIAEATRPVGALLVDRRAGVSGKLGVSADLLPVRVTLRLREGAPPRSYRFEVARVPALLPDLAVWTVTNALLDQEDLRGRTTVDVSLRLDLAGEEPLHTRASLSGTDVSASLADEVKLPLLLATANPDRDLRIEGVDVELDLRHEIRSAALGRVLTEPLEPRPGDTLRLRVEILPFRSPAEWVELEVVLPPQIRSGPVGIHVGDGGSAFRDEVVRTTERWRHLGVRQIREALALRLPASSLVATLYGPPRSTVVRGVELEQLPPSVRWVLARRHGVSGPGQERVAATRLDQAYRDTPWVLQGTRQIILQVGSDEERDAED